MKTPTYQIVIEEDTRASGAVFYRAYVDVIKGKFFFGLFTDKERKRVCGDYMFRPTREFINIRLDDNCGANCYDTFQQAKDAAKEALDKYIKDTEEATTVCRREFRLPTEP